MDLLGYFTISTPQVLEKVQIPTYHTHAHARTHAHAHAHAHTHTHTHTYIHTHTHRNLSARCTWSEPLPS